MARPLCSVWRPQLKANRYAALPDRVIGLRLFYHFVSIQRFCPCPRLHPMTPLRLLATPAATVAALGLSLGCRTPGPHDCPVPVPRPVSQASAIACAEAFIARNRYTTASARGPVQLIAWETFELFPGLPESTVASRAGRLRPKAAWICDHQFPNGKRTVPGYTVGFEEAGRRLPVLDSLWRIGESPRPDSVVTAVTMNLDLTDLWVQHEPLVLGDPDLDGGHCRHSPP